MNLFDLIFGVIFLVLGIVFGFTKSYTHLKAWKAMPEKDRAKVKIVPLCRNVGGMIALAGILFLLKGAISGYGDRAFVITMVAWLVLAGIDVAFITKSKRYRNEED